MVVLGFFSPDGTVKEEHVHYEKQDPRHNFVVCEEECLLEDIVEQFAPPAGMVLDLTCLQGTSRLSVRYSTPCT